MQKAKKVNKASASYKSLGIQCSFYDFQVVCDKNVKLELVAQSKEDFESWKHAVEAIVKNKKNLAKLRTALK